MNALGYRLPLIGLVGMGLVGCSAAGGNAGQRGSSDGDQPGLELAVGAAANEPADADARSAGGSTWHSEKPLSDGQGDGNDSGRGGQGHCDCGVHLPGITVDESSDGITIIVELPNDGSIAIETKNGHCRTGEGGLDVAGDLTVDLGSGTDVLLLDANLHVGVGGELPTIEGTADVDAGLLDGITGSAVGDAQVTVSLDPNVGQIMPESHAQALIRLQLALPRLGVGCGCFPAMNGDLPLADADVVVSVDGCHQVLTVTADVADDAGKIWTPVVPLHATGQLTAMATINDGALVSLALDGGVSIDSGALWCGLTPLAAIALPSAKLVLDEQGATLTATTRDALHPGFGLTGEAKLSARFGEHEWSINLCGASMADLALGSAKVATCLDLSAAGAKVCDEPGGS